MQAIHQMNRSQLLQEQMNKQEEANYNLYKRQHSNTMPYYVNTQSNKMAYYNNKDFINDMEQSSMKNNELNKNTQENATAYIPTKENLHLSHQYIDSYNHNPINSTETVRDISFEYMNNISAQNNNIRKESIENTLQKNNCYFEEGKFGCVNTEEMETYLNKQNRGQEINTYKNFTINANQLLHINSEQKLSSVDESNTVLNSMQTVPVYSHHDLINSTPSDENIHFEMPMDMHARSDAETREHSHEQLNTQVNYYNQKEQENYENVKHLKRNIETSENTYESTQSYLNANQSLERNEQEETSCEYITEHEINVNRIRYEQYGSRLNDYHHIQQYHNNGNMINRMNTINCYSNTAENIDASDDTLGHFSKNFQNNPSTMMCKNAPKAVDNEYITYNAEENEGEANMRIDDIEPLDGMMKIKTIDINTETMNHFHQFSQENANEWAQNRKHHNIINNSDLQQKRTMQNADFYENTPILQNVNKYSNVNNVNTFSMNNTMEMKNQFNEMDNTHVINKTEYMNRYKTYLQQKEQQNRMSGKEYLNSQTDGHYNINDIKSFMLEPKLYSKMNLDLPEVVDGITTSHNDGIVENAKKETIIKYKDTWRLVPGKSCAISQNGNINSEDNNIKAFQNYLDKSNEKTQNMLLNSSFNALTGRLHINPLSNEQPTNDFNKVYDYKDQTIAFPNCYTQLDHLAENGNGSVNMLNQMMINGAGNENNFNFTGMNHFVPTNGSSNIYGKNSLKHLNEITKADEINNITGLNYMAPTNNFNYPISIGENKAFLNSDVIINGEEKNITKKKVTKKQTFALCGENRLKFNIKTFITKAVKDYFKGNVTI